MPSSRDKLLNEGDLLIDEDDPYVTADLFDTLSPDHQSLVVDFVIALAERAPAL